MAGLYIHIPFCRSRCAYCDFFSTTALDRREAYVEALWAEWQVRKSEVTEPIETIYFGGGTPSLLTAEQVKRLAMSGERKAAKGERLRVTGYGLREVTLEANPDSVSLPLLKELRQVGVNRLSIGIQSLQDELLRTIGRRHNAAQAIEAVRIAREAGFSNLSVDLMYGLPTQTMAQWKEDIERVIELKPEHLSTYCLSYEEGTALTKQRDKGEVQELNDETLNRFYDYLCERLQAAGYEHYEVSNFALPGYCSKHNSNYWNHTPYIGLGAGAHSFDGVRRSWNPADLEVYIAGALAQSLQREQEVLTEEQRHIEQIMLGLRTKEGIEISLVADKESQVEDFLRRGLLQQEETKIRATREGLHILNEIIATLI